MEQPIIVRYQWMLAELSCATKYHGYLLYPQPQLFNWLPRHVFQSEEEFAAFYELAKEKVAKCREIG